MSRTPLPARRPQPQGVVDAPTGPDASYIKSIRFESKKILFRSDGVVGSLRGPYIAEVVLTDLGLQDFHPGIRAAAGEVQCVYTTGPLPASLSEFPGLGPGWYFFLHRNNVDALRVSIEYYQHPAGGNGPAWFRDAASQDHGPCPLTLAYRRWFFHIATSRPPDYVPAFEPPQWGPWEALIRRQLALYGN